MSDASSRTIPATPRRREAARREGLGAPADLPAWAASAATAILLAPAWAQATIPAAAESLRQTCAAVLTAGGSVADLPWPLPVAVVLPTLGVVAASTAAGLAVRFAADGFAWQPGRAAPDPRRIDPLAGLRRIFSRGTVSGVGIAAAGLTLLTAAAWSLARPLLNLQAQPVAVDELGGIAAAGWRAVVWLVAAAALVGGGQWLLARRRFELHIRMTPQELADEVKDLQADPRVRLLQQPKRTR
jgi:flagellar biosynthetic protein FlhB